jgi:hypothetical protein
MWLKSAGKKWADLKNSPGVLTIISLINQFDTLKTIKLDVLKGL